MAEVCCHMIFLGTVSTLTMPTRAIETSGLRLIDLQPYLSVRCSTSMSSSSRRVVIVTGAAEGIGHGIALRLAKDGYDLGLFDLPQAQGKLDSLATTIQNEYGVRVVKVTGSVAVEEDVKRLVETVVQELGSLYAVCPGIFGPSLAIHS